jgi:hypothetical protein
MVGTVNSTARGAGNKPLSSPGQCTLLLTLASLPVRLMKDKKVKNSLMPCLVIVCLEAESNVAVVRRSGKASYVRKYLELAINEHLELGRDSAGEESTLRRQKLRCLSDLLPADMWEVAQLAWSVEEGVKSAKI